MHHPIAKSAFRRRLTNSLILSSLLVCFSGSTCFGQDPTHHKVVTYHPHDYESHNQNWSIAQNERGILYFANGDGLLEFDGVKWRATGTSRLTTLLSLRIDEKGRVFTGGIGEIGYYVPDSVGRLMHVDMSGEIPKDMHLGHVWFTMFNKGCTYFQMHDLMIIKSGDEYAFKKPQSKFYGTYLVNGEVYAVDRTKGVYRFEGTEMTVELNTDTIKQSVISIESYSDHELLLVMNYGNPYIYNTHSKQLMKMDSEIEEKLPSAQIYRSYGLSNGNYLFSITDFGLLEINKNGKIVDSYSEKDGILSGSINDIFQDHEGNVWLATNKGICMIDYSSPITQIEEGGGFTGVINCIDKFEGEYYMGTDEGVYKVNNKSLDVTEPLCVHVEGAHSLAFDLLKFDGELILAHVHGLERISKDGMKNINSEYSRSMVDIKGVEGRKLLFVGGRRTLEILEKKSGEFKRLIYLDDFGDEVLRVEQAFKGVEEGKLVFWIGLFSDGIAKMTIDKETWNYDLEYYGENYGFDPGYVVPFRVDDELKFITKFQSTYIYQSDRNSFKVDEPLQEILGEVASYFMFEDSVGRIYAEAEGPIYIIEPGPDGMKVMDAQSLNNLGVGYFNDLYIDENNICWLAGEQAFMRYDPKKKKDYQMSFPVSIRKVETTNDSLLFDGDYGNIDSIIYVQDKAHQPILNYKDNNLVIEFAAAYYQDFEETNYSFFLDGFSSDWSSWKNEHKAVFTNLPAGEFVFKVKAINKFGVESEEATYSFSILPPWYNTYWAYALFGLFGILILFALIRLNSKRLKAANLKLEKIIEENVSELTKQRDTLKTQKEEVELQRDLVNEKNKEITDSIQYAKRLQEAILPPRKLVEKWLPDSFILYLPKDIVAGDFYWMEVVDDVVYFAVADCTGHGVPGAMVSVVCSNALSKSLLEEKIGDPGKILDRTRELVVEQFKRGDDEVRDGMDLSLCKFDTSNNEFYFAGANNAAWVVKKGSDEVEETKGDKQPIGRYDVNKPFNTHQLNVEKGDTLYFTSDGYPDQFGGEKGKKMKTTNMKKLLVSLNALSLDQQKIKLGEEFNSWKGDLEQIDDVCVLGFKL